MALWKNEAESNPTSGATPARNPDVSISSSAASTTPDASRRTSAAASESLIASGLVIEGKIEGSGHVRIAGNFNGDVNVDGNLTIEPGAKVTGGVRAARVSVGGELEGNIDAASSVELTSTGVLNGDLKAGSLTVAAGSRMRGKVEFGWTERAAPSKSATTSHTASPGKSGSTTTA